MSTVARLRPNCRGYPELERNRWYHVTKTEDLGIFIQLGNRARFLFWRDVEVINDPANAGTPVNIGTP